MSNLALTHWSRIRISPDPPVTQRDHSNVVPFLLSVWNVSVTYGGNRPSNKKPPEGGFSMSWLPKALSTRA